MTELELNAGFAQEANAGRNTWIGLKEAKTEGKVEEVKAPERKDGQAM